MVDGTFEMELLPEGRLDVLNTRVRSLPRRMTITVRCIITACTCEYFA